MDENINNVLNGNKEVGVSQNFNNVELCSMKYFTFKRSYKRF